LEALIERFSQNKKMKDKYVTSPNIFYRKSRKFDEEGLFSERIFGPIKDFKCKCGKLNSEILDGGKRCEKCKVLCESSNLRLETFGLIELPFECIKPTKIKNRLKKVILNVLTYTNTLLDPIRNDNNINKSRYLGINKTNQAINIFENRKDTKNIYIPMRITGLYSLVFCLKYIRDHFYGFQNVQDLFDDQIFMSHLKIIPPTIRPVNIVNNKQQYTEVNKSYISLINLNKSSEMLKDNLCIDEEDWNKQIELYFADPNFENNEEEIIEHMIIECDTITAKYQFHINQVYVDLMRMISGKSGFIRNNMLGKTIEFSARSIITCDPSLEPYQIGVSRKILYKLWMLYFLYWLIQVKNINTVWCFENIITKTYEENKALFNKFIEWMEERAEGVENI
jgi:DNA-directed RNA polymerase subunit beta'